jgi:hypothetical protein
MKMKRFVASVASMFISLFLAWRAFAFTLDSVASSPVRASAARSAPFDGKA